MKKLIAILTMACLAACEYPYSDVPSKPQPIPYVNDRRIRFDFQSVYRAVFHRDQIYSCCYSDNLHDYPEALAVGSTGIMGATELPVIAQDSDATGLYVWKPPTSPPQETVSVGLYIPHLNYGPGTAFVLRAAFRRPDGPHLPVDAQNPELTNAWSVGVQARTGGLPDSGNLKRLSVTFRVKNNGAVLNVQGINETLDPVAIGVDPATYSAIFDHHEPFTIELIVDRRDGSGKATLYSGSLPQTIVPFTMSYFKKDDGDPITVAGPTLANCCSPNGETRVEVLVVQLFELRPIF